MCPEKATNHLLLKARDRAPEVGDNRTQANDCDATKSRGDRGFPASQIQT
jgi:hypothetical protein